jgi:hypothetical protein
LQTFAFTQNGFTAYVTALDVNEARTHLENNPSEMHFKLVASNTYVGFKGNKWDFKQTVPLRHLVAHVEIVGDDKTAITIPEPKPVDIEEVR